MTSAQLTAMASPYSVDATPEFQMFNRGHRRLPPLPPLHGAVLRYPSLRAGGSKVKYTISAIGGPEWGVSGRGDRGVAPGIVRARLVDLLGDHEAQDGGSLRLARAGDVCRPLARYRGAAIRRGPIVACPCDAPAETDEGPISLRHVCVGPDVAGLPSRWGPGAPLASVVDAWGPWWSAGVNWAYWPNGGRPGSVDAGSVRVWLRDGLVDGICWQAPVDGLSIH